MNNMQQLTERSALLIQIMFGEPDITNTLIDGRESNLYSRVDIDPETNAIVLGKTRFNWWNHLVGATKTISLNDFALRVIGVLASKAKQNQKPIKEGLLNDMVDSLIREGKSNDMIDRLFLVGYMGVKTSWSCTTWDAQEVQKEHDGKLNLNVKVNERVETFELPGSGDKIFQVLIGPKGVRYLGDDQSGDYDCSMSVY